MKKTFTISMKHLLAVIVLIFSAAFLTGCDYDIYTMADKVPSVENLTFTDDGRLFFTGSGHIYEYTREKGMTKVFSTENAEFGGIAQVGNQLYVIRMTMAEGGLYPVEPINLVEMLDQGVMASLFYMLSDAIARKEILVANLDEAPAADGTMAFAALDNELEDMVMPNGMTADSQGNLYIADETILSLGQIVKITPVGNTFIQEQWLTHGNGLYSPNGMAIRGNTIYFTDFRISTMTTYVKSVDIVNGRAGTVKRLFQKTGLFFFDDLAIGTISCKGRVIHDAIVVADYGKGSLWFLESDGTMLEDLPRGEFDMPSAAYPGMGPMFNSNDIIVCEKGMLMENDSNYGNKVSVLTWD